MEDAVLGGSRMALLHARSVMTEQEPTGTNGAEAFSPENGYSAAESLSRPRYSRVLLKLGGEMFGGGGVGLDPDAESGHEAGWKMLYWGVAGWRSCMRGV